MNGFAALPLPLRLVLIAILGACAGGLANWAIYTFAWHRRMISPWSPGPRRAPSRRISDRVPILGWVGLRREASIHGEGFWVRPMTIEIALALGFAALYWWEVEAQALYLVQLEPLAGPRLARAAQQSAATLHIAFCGHALLIVLMTVASFIDIDDWIIPDAVTVVGTLLGLVLVSTWPAILLPHVGTYSIAPLGGTPVAVGQGVIQVQGETVYALPVFLCSPADWPRALAAFPNGNSLALGLGCFWLWCFALVPRIWRGRRGMRTALWLIGARIWREARRPIMLLIEIGGTLGILVVWKAGGLAWAALLSALVGMIAGGGIVWAVRLVGTAALRREAMGFGDVTLMMMVGTFLGWQASLFIFFLAPLAGVVVGVLRLVLFRDRELPYGPFLCLAALAVIVHWGTIWEWAHPVFGVPGLVPVALAVCVPLMYGMLLIMRLVFIRDVHS